VTIIGFAASTSYPLAIALLFGSGFLNLTFLSMVQTHRPQPPLAQRPPRAQRRHRRRHRRLIGIHWSLAVSAMVLLAVTVALFALVIPGRGGEIDTEENSPPRRRGR
jgi:Ca2+/Na+ antiporter